MNASLKLLHSVLPASVGLRVTVPAGHASAPILGTERMGSGTLVDESGIVLTVSYVVIGAESIEVTLLDETRVNGHVIAQDLHSGIAAVKIPGNGYPVARWASADALRIGQDVFILASAGGSQRRVNSGGVSALEPFDAFWEYHLERGILTTAMNPGLGGGGLFTCAGELTGIVSLDLNEVGRFTLGIPVDHFAAHRAELLQHGRRVSRPSRAWVGMYCYVLREHVVIAGVLPGTPAEQAGLHPGDVVVSVDGQRVSVRRDLYQRLWLHRPGDVVRFQVFRENSVHEIAVPTSDIEVFFA